ncbi:ABC transporter ATP-binding protein [Actinophytocola sp.]|uniref:ABC transporter ATP-binding protein n=1 Tax=Actinophytocola sp. TaxID=1872138 RepID=UPI002D80AC2F|nr:ABC transporter ATP-binding protein [Actinophytocola sp.]HET9140036.1 ABC transporter ATP-binding protein [Actinophytocola sp.]
MTDEPAVLTATGLGKRYRRTWALRDCSLAIPAGRVVALVGPNGAGKTTLLHLVIGLRTPTQGSLRVLGEPPGKDTTLPRVAFMAQERPLYDGFTVADMLRFGRRLNPRWDADLGEKRLAALDIPLDRKVGQLSGGQQAQVALTLALGKRPDLLLLDEPLANLDPLARHDLMRALMTAVAETGLTVVLSSHIVADLENTCDWLVVLNRGRVQVSGDLEELLRCHQVLSGPAELADRLPEPVSVIEDDRAERQASLLVRAEPSTVLDPRWHSRPVGLEELVLAYLRRPEAATLPRPSLTRI